MKRRNHELEDDVLSEELVELIGGDFKAKGLRRFVSHEVYVTVSFRSGDLEPVVQMG